MLREDTTILCIDSAPPKTDEDKSWTITIGEGLHAVLLVPQLQLQL